MLLVNQISWDDTHYHLIDQLGLLLWRSELKEFLDDVVPKDVRHQTVGGGKDLLEDQLLLGGRCSLQLLLDEPGAVLVLAELHDVVGEVPELEVGVAIIPEINSINVGSVFKQNCMARQCREIQSLVR